MGRGRCATVDMDATVEVGGGHARAGELLERYCTSLVEREAAPATVTKYLRAARGLLCYVVRRAEPLTKDVVMGYKDELVHRYAPATVNTMLAAVNGFLRELGLAHMCVRRLRVQPPDERPPERDLGKGEYLRLVRAASEAGDERMALVIQTICSTGIRVSELAYVTVEAARTGRFVVRNKGKARTAYLPRKLAQRLRAFATRRGLREGPVFVGRGGRPLDRTWIWRKMKEYGRAAGVDAQKVYPHNLRHLFALTFYRVHGGDIDSLGRLLGHSRIETTRVYLVEGKGSRSQQVEALGLLLP